MNEQEDRRYKRTEAMLRDALMTLLTEKPINKITVTDLVKKADVGRGTFYLHYTDIDDMIGHLHDACLNRFMPLLKRYSGEPDIEPFLFDLFRIVEQERDLLKYFPQDSDSVLYKALKNFAKEKCAHDWKELFNASDDKIDLLFPYIFNGTVGLIKHWLTDLDCSIPAADMAYYAKDIIFNSHHFISADIGPK